MPIYLPFPTGESSSSGSQPGEIIEVLPYAEEERLS